MQYNINCYSTGNIGGGGHYQGGIVGPNAGQEGLCTITDCYSIGNIGGGGGNYQGGIAGENTGYDGSCNITNCYSTGKITGNNAGGITGLNTGSTSGGPLTGICNITNCYSTGEIAGNFAGGITGGETAVNGGTVNISGCYVLGATSVLPPTAYTLYGNDVCGGTINITNSTPQTNSQTTQSWSDSSANTYFTGLNSTWKNVTPITVSAEPWKLKAFLNDRTHNFVGTTMTYTNNVFPIMPFKNSDISFNLKLMGGNNSVLLKSTDISHNANTVAFTGLPTNLHTSDFYLKDGYVDHFYQDHPLGLSGENITLWQQSSPGGNISISGDEYYGHTEISGGNWPVTILGTGTKVTLETDLVLDVSTNYFKFATGCSAEFVGDTIIPQKTVDVSGVTDGWPGLFDCSSSGSTMNVGYLGLTASNGSELA